VATASPEPGDREQGDDQAGGQPHPGTQRPTDPRGRLVLLGDPHLAVLSPLDHRGVIGVQQPGLGVQVLDQLVVGFRVVHVGIHPDVGHERVDGHLVPPCVAV
jgi:hypothetical protein